MPGAYASAGVGAIAGQPPAPAKKPAGSRRASCLPVARRDYLMNSISEYFGSGQRSSATMLLEPVGDLAHVFHRRDHAVVHVARPPRRRRVVLVVSEVRVLQGEQLEVQLLDDRLDLADELVEPYRLQLLEVADRGRQDLRARDRCRRLRLDVDLDRVLLEEDLVAGLELAL